MMLRDAASLLFDTTLEMHSAGVPLMRRVLPDVAVAEIWTHYPVNDAVSASGGGRYFYHAHPPGERNWGEHGHFHIFLPKTAFADDMQPVLAPQPSGAKRADVVHIAALSVNETGIPVQLFTVNRWVTDEWLYAADDIAARLPAFSLVDAPGDPLVNRWLTSMVHLYSDEIIALLHERDEKLAAADPSGNDRSVEIMSMIAVDLDEKLEALLG